eukprot:TRINITY_DN4978_c0_g1_i1.p1 TRINITY_DN4978_c0_g1~~TRINITY_DN4978_c0_g1_i1.p1  ORF type:complete len:277 (+),score=79.99 TRINITY_DN4978_c0_g1_i1:49-831(+)
MCIRDRPTTVIKGLIDVESFGVMRDPSLNEEENVEDLTKKQKDKKTSEKKERDYEDELMSAAELHTTDTAEETDIEEAKLSRKAQRLQDKMEEMAYKMKIETSQTSSTNEPSTSDASHELSEDYETSFKIDKMLAEMEEKEKEVIEQFEVEYEKAKRKDLFMYGQEEDKKALEVSEFLKQREALKAIPNSVVSKIADFSSPRLKYQTNCTRSKTSRLRRRTLDLLNQQKRLTRPLLLRSLRVRLALLRELLISPKRRSIN